MSLISLRSIAPEGEVFYFSFVPGQEPAAINFIGERQEDVLLHISLRPAERTVVLNSTSNCEWETEVVFPWLRASAYAPTELCLTAESGRLKVAIDGALQWEGPWRRDLTLAQDIVLDRDDLYVRRGPKKGVQHVLESEIVSLSSGLRDRLTAIPGDLCHKKAQNTAKREMRIGLISDCDGTSLQQAVDRMAPQLDKLFLAPPADSAVSDTLVLPANATWLADFGVETITDLLTAAGVARNDDAFLFPLSGNISYSGDYSDRLVDAARTYGGPVGVEGVFVTTDELAARNGEIRSVLPANAALRGARRVHALAPETICVPLRGMADGPLSTVTSMWNFSRQCALNGKALHAIPRESGWIDRVGTAAPEPALAAVRAEVARLAPAAKGVMTKAMIAIKTYNREFYIRECLDTMISTLADESKFDVTIVVADDGSVDGTLESLAKLSIPFETHVIQNRRAYVSGQFNSILRLFEERRGDFLVIVDDDVVFKKPGWLSAYHGAAIESGYHHLCHFNLPHFGQLATKSKEPFPPPAMRHSQFPLVAYQTVERCMGALITITPNVVRDVGYADERNFAVRGLWHVDYSARACRAGYNEYARFFDIEDAHDYIELQNTLKQRYITSIAWNTDEFKNVSTKEERARRQRVLRMRDRIRVPLGVARRGPVLDPPEKPTPVVNLGTCFDGVYILGATDAPAVKAVQSFRAAPVALARETSSAVDALERLRQLAKSWKDGVAGGAALFRTAAPAAKTAYALIAAAKTDSDLSNLNWAARAFYRQALSEAISLGYRNVLLLDGDMCFQENFGEAIDSLMADLPPRWRMLHFHADFAEGCEPLPYSSTLALNPGGALGSLAVALNGDAMYAVLEHLKRDCLPVDLGALNLVARIWPESCFVARPALITPIKSSQVAPQRMLSSKRNVAVVKQ